MKDLKKILDQRVSETFKNKMKFDILYVTDESSRLSFTRGQIALDEFRRFYANIATVSVVTMDSNRFCNHTPDLSEFNVIWVDNVINGAFNTKLAQATDAVLTKVMSDWKDGIDELNDEEYGQYIELVNEIRATYCRIIYTLDEFVWEAPAGRQKNVISAKTVESAMDISDEVIVPNAEMAGALKELGLVDEKKEVIVIPTFMSDYFYPVNKNFRKSNSLSTRIRKPRVLVKGTIIPENVQNFIIHSTDQFAFTVCSVSELDDRLMKLIADHKVENLIHWANPYVNSRNMFKTAALERDGNFDFVLLTVPTEEDENNNEVVVDPYNITNVDTDALMGVAYGAVVLAGVEGAHYGKGMHLCVESKMTFNNKTSVKDLNAMLTKWSICANWDSAYDAQRKLLGTKLVSSPSVLGGYFNAMLGRTVAEARKKHFDDIPVESK